MFLPGHMTAEESESFNLARTNNVMLRQGEGSNYQILIALPKEGGGGGISNDR